MTAVRTFLLGMGWAAIALGQNQQIAAPQSLLGCYDISIGTWQGGGDGWVASNVSLVPRRVQLDTVRSGTGNVWIMRAVPGVAPSMHRHTQWYLRADSLTMSWGSGFSGISARGEVRGDSIRGVARVFTDQIGGPPLPSAPFSAVRASCDAPMLDRERLSTRIPRGVRLRGGDSLLVDVPLDTAVMRSLRHKQSIMYAVDGEVEAPFSGSVSDVLVANDTAAAIRLEFPADAGLDSVVSGFKTRYGDPFATTTGVLADGSEVETSGWRSARVLFWLRMIRTPGGVVSEVTGGFRKPPRS